MAAGKEQTWALALVLTAVVADYVGVTMMRVALPFYAKSLGGGGTFIGSLETAYGFGQWVGAITLPKRSDAWGRKGVMVLCCCCSAAGYALAIASLAVASPVMLLLSRFPVGLAKQTVTISRAVVADCTKADGDRSRWMAFQCAALAVGCSLGPLLASWAAEHLGESAPVAAAAALFVVLGPIVAATLPETLPGAAHESLGPGASAAAGPPLWRSARVVAVLLLLALPELGLVAHQGVTLNTFSVQHLGMGKPWVAKLNSLSAVLQATVAGTVCASLARRGWSDAALMRLGCGSFAAASLAIWWFRSAEAVIFSAPLAAAANSVLRSSPAALLSKQVPELRQGEAMGLLDVCSSALRVAAPVLAGVLMDAFGGPSAFLFQAGLFVAAILGLLILSHHDAVSTSAAKAD